MNRQQFVRALEQLRGWREYAFTLALAERAFPNYALFAEAVGRKWAGPVRDIMDRAWAMLEARKHDQDALRLLSRLESLIPDPEAFDMYGARPASDMTRLLEQALLSRVNPDRRRAPEAATLSRDTVMGFVEMSEGEGLDDHALVSLLDRHELMQAELAYQQALVQMLRRRRSPDEAFVAELRELAANGGVSNLGVALDGDEA